MNQFYANLTALIFLSATLLSAQQSNSQCVNMGFENGDFTGWTGDIQDRNISSPIGTAIPGPILPGFLQHCIMTKAMTDPLVPMLPVVPAGANYSVRIGNTATGGHIARLRQTFGVSPDSSNLLFTYSYAVVLEDPAGAPNHEGLNRPYFIVRLYDQNGNEIKCAFRPEVVQTGLAGYTHVCVQENTNNETAANTGCPDNAVGSDGSGVNTAVSSTIITSPNCTGGISNIYYKDWHTITISLSSFIGQNVTIEFAAADCTPGGHRGYAYVSSQCGSVKYLQTPILIHSGQEVKTLYAPEGFVSYDWTGPGIIGRKDAQTVQINQAGIYHVSVLSVANPDTTVGDTCGMFLTYAVREDAGPTGIFAAASGATLRLYPNPAKEVITIDLENEEDYLIEVSDISGKPIAVQVMREAGKAELQIGRLSKGMYFVRVNGRQKVLHAPFVVE
jgi:hypothetical protein